MNHFLTHGAISWSELATDDPGAAAKFYASVFGWTTEVMPMPMGDYTVCQINSAGMCGIMKKPEANMPNAWMYYLTVDDINETVKKATELGATIVVPPFEVPTIGTFAGFQDPQGAFIMAVTYDPSDVENNNANIDFANSFKTSGAFSWFELRTPDPKAAADFYSALLGWNVTIDNMGTGPYYTIKVGDVGIGGIIQPPPGPEVPPHWGAYVTVDDVDRTMNSITAGGGTIMMEPFDIEKVGRILMFQDPQGAWLSAIKYVEMTAA